MLSGDCLQLDGVGEYRNGVGYLDLYKASIVRLKNMDIKRIVAAHEFDPLGSVAEGEEEVQVYLDECINIQKRKINI